MRLAAAILLSSVLAMGSTLNVGDTLVMHVTLSDTWTRLVGPAYPDEVVPYLVGDSANIGDRFSLTLTSGMFSETVQGEAVNAWFDGEAYHGPAIVLQSPIRSLPASIWATAVEVGIADLDRPYVVDMFIPPQLMLENDSLGWEVGDGLASWSIVQTGGTIGGEQVPTPEPSSFVLLTALLLFAAVRVPSMRRCSSDTRAPA